MNRACPNQTVPRCCVTIEFILRRGVAAVATARPKLNAKASKGKQKLTEAQIAVHWKEEEFFRPSKAFIAQANLADPAFVKKFSEKNFPECFDHYASLLDWDKPWRKTLDTRNGIPRRHHLPGTLQTRQRSCRDAARFRRAENRRPRHHPYADDSRVARHHAGVRAARCCALRR